jgi:hypothetical protein
MRKTLVRIGPAANSRKILSIPHRNLMNIYKTSLPDIQTPLHSINLTLPMLDYIVQEDSLARSPAVQRPSRGVKCFVPAAENVSRAISTFLVRIMGWDRAQ